jgi:hypothetical protein
MQVFVVRENYSGEILGVFTNNGVVKELMSGYDVSIDGFDLDEAIHDWLPRFAQYKKGRGCEEETPPPSLESLHSNIKRYLERTIRLYNDKSDYGARQAARRLINLLDKGKALGYNMEPIESFIDQRLKDNHQAQLSIEDFVMHQQRMEKEMK